MDALMNPPAEEGVSPTSFSSLPEGLLDTIKSTAESFGFPTIRSACDEIVIDLCDALDSGETIEIWPSSKPGIGHVRETIRFSDTVAERMRKTAAHHQARLGAFFVVAAYRWLAKHGVEFKPSKST